MTIAYLCADFGVPYFGTKGASVHMREMVAAFREAGHSVHVISPALDPGEGGETDRSGAEGPLDAAPAPRASGEARLTRVAVPLDPRHAEVLDQIPRVEGLIEIKTRVRQEMRNVLYNLTLYDRAREALRGIPVDFVYERYTLFHFAGIRLAESLDVPHLLEVNAPLSEEQERMRGLEMVGLARETERRILRATDAAIVVSSRLAGFARACGAAEEKIHVLPNGVDPRRFASPVESGQIPAAVRARLRGRCTIGFVGSLKPWHGAETLFEAFRDLSRRRPEAHLLVVGDGPTRDALEAFARANGLEQAVTFTGAVPYEAVAHYLAAVDVAVAPYTPHENFYFSPIKVFEYMAAGRAVVAGRIGQIEELVRDGETALLFEPGSVDGLARALERLVEDPGLRERLGKAAWEWVRKERTWAANARKVIEIASAALEKRGRGSEGARVGAEGFRVRLTDG